MSELTEFDIKYLKSIFSMKWPDAAKSLKKGPEMNWTYPEAACLWNGFKKGYALRRAEK